MALTDMDDKAAHAGSVIWITARNSTKKWTELASEGQRDCQEFCALSRLINY
jgi:hypothetical protein